MYRPRSDSGSLVSIQDPGPVVVACVIASLEDWVDVGRAVGTLTGSGVGGGGWPLGIDAAIS